MGLSPLDGQVQLPIKDWVTRVTTEHRLALQKRIITFLLRAFGSSLVAALGIFLLQGFGFIKLSEAVLKFIGTATLGAMAGLLTLTFRAVVRKEINRSLLNKTPAPDVLIEELESCAHDPNS